MAASPDPEGGGRRLLLVSSRVRNQALLSSALLPTTVVVPYNYDHATLPTLEAQARRTLAEDEAVKSIAVLTTTAKGGAGLGLCQGFERVTPESFRSGAAEASAIALNRLCWSLLAAGPSARLDLLGVVSAADPAGLLLQEALASVVALPVNLVGDLAMSDSTVPVLIPDPTATYSCEALLADYFDLFKLKAIASPSGQSMDGFERIRVVGKGAYGAAILYRKRDTGSLIILKEINLNDMSTAERQMAFNEARVLSILDHPNIISYHDCFEENGMLQIEMEYADGGTLTKKLETQAEPLPEKTILRWFRQMVSALDYIHERHVLHRDLKTGNIFLTKEGDIKLGDFGISKVVTTNTKANTVLGTPYYISPELCQGQAYGSKSDMWAAGCILHEMATLKRTFDGSNLPALVHKIVNGRFSPITGPYGNDFKALIGSLLQHEPGKRPSASDLLGHPLLQDFAQPACPPGGPQDDDYASDASSDFEDPKTIYTDVYYWGFHDATPLRLTFETGIRITMMATGYEHVVALSEERHVFSWGGNEYGQLGRGNQQFCEQPAIVESMSGRFVTQVACGGHCTAFVSENGLLQTCGRGEFGSLGHGDQEHHLTPQLVQEFLSAEVSQVAVGSAHMVAILGSGEVYAWGLSSSGRLGLGPAAEGMYTVPQRVDVPAAVLPTRVVCGVDCTMILGKEGRLLATGSNQHNKLGLNARFPIRLKSLTVETATSFAPVKFGKKLKVASMSLGLNFSLVVTRSGKVYSFGQNARGQLGHGHYKPREMPSSIKGPLAGHRIKSIACGEGFAVAAGTCASAPGSHQHRAKKSRVFAWGDSWRDRDLGASSSSDGSSLRPSEPEQVELFALGKNEGRTVLDVACCGSMIAIVVECAEFLRSAEIGPEISFPGYRRASSSDSRATVATTTSNDDGNTPSSDVGTPVGSVVPDWIQQELDAAINAAPAAAAAKPAVPESSLGTASTGSPQPMPLPALVPIRRVRSRTINVSLPSTPTAQTRAQPPLGSQLAPPALSPTFPGDRETPDASARSSVLSRRSSVADISADSEAESDRDSSARGSSRVMTKRSFPRPSRPVPPKAMPTAPRRPFPRNDGHSPIPLPVGRPSPGDTLDSALEALSRYEAREAALTQEREAQAIKERELQAEIQALREEVEAQREQVKATQEMVSALHDRKASKRQTSALCTVS